MKPSAITIHISDGSIVACGHIEHAIRGGVNATRDDIVDSHDIDHAIGGGIDATRDGIVDITPYRSRHRRWR